MPKRLAESGLTIAQETFAQQVALGKSQADAYRVAYPKSLKWKATAIHECASRLAADNKVSSRIQALTAARLEQIDRDHGLTLDSWARQNARLAFSDVRKVFTDDGRLKPITEIDDDTAAAIEAVKVSRTRTTVNGETREEEAIVEYKLARKSAALDQIGRYLGAFEKDNAQKQDSAVTALLTFIADRARLRAVPGEAARQADVVDVQPAPTALLPKG